MARFLRTVLRRSRTPPGLATAGLRRIAGADLIGGRKPHVRDLLHLPAPVGSGCGVPRCRSAPSDGSALHRRTGGSGSPRPAAVERNEGAFGGFSQGWRFLVLESESDRTAFWTVLREDMPVDESFTAAPLVIVPMGSKDDYLSRYAEPDKGWDDRDEARWAVPFWFTDTAMAALLILQTAVDNRLGALFFGVPPAVNEAFLDAFNVPGDYHPVGGIAVGHPADDPPFVAGAQRKLAQVVQHGSWAQSPHDDRDDTRQRRLAIS